MIRVLSPGTRSLFQDLGRPHYQHQGVPVSGAADPAALRLANTLVGNAAACAAIEVTLCGPTLLFHDAHVVAYTGGDADLALDGRPVPAGHTLYVSPGQVLTVGALRSRVFGYLSVAGGFSPPPVLGSRSTCTLSGLGPAPLAEADLLPVGAPVHPGARGVGPRAVRETRTLRVDPSVRLLPGPHASLFSPEAWARLVEQPWQVSRVSSRVGTRLAGHPLDVPAVSLPSLGMVRGAVQVPPDGQPIVLGPDHGATGGYPVIGVVATSDQARVQQTRAGQTVRFTPASPPTANCSHPVNRVLALDRVAG